MGSRRHPWTLAILALIAASSSLVLSSLYLLGLSGAVSWETGELLLAQVSPTLLPFHTSIGTPDVAGSISTGIGTTNTNTRYAPTNIQKTLYPGELPGYTGWPRPTSTLAGSFRIVGDSSWSPASTTANAANANAVVVVGKNWTCSIHCSHEACQHGGSLLYIRAYGPAILPGQYTDHRNGTYDVTFLPLDAGIYTVEVVLTFSNPPAFSEFPVAVRREPAYEGYMLPGFPAAVSVKGGGSSSSDSGVHSVVDPPLPLCTMSQLLETGPSSAVQTGRWLVREKNIERISNYNHTPSSNNSNDDINLDDYEEGYNSLGVHMEYRPTKCSLLDEAAIRGNNMLQQCRQTSMQNGVAEQAPRMMLRVIFIGDSNIAKQYVWAGSNAVIGGHFRYSVIVTNRGINERLPEIKTEIAELLRNDQRQGPSMQYQYVVIFNSGLHDILFLCGSNHWGLRINYTARGDARCADLYREKLTELVRAIQQIPSVLTVFQTTTAAWPKWGTFGGSWPAAKKQPMPFTTSFVEYFNEIAWDIMREMRIPVMDTYWLTLSRPDHREVSEDNNIKNKMCHAGPQVYSVLVRKWFMMILESICPSVVPRLANR
jgi:hypothetical protein